VNLESLLAPFLTWQFVLTCVLINVAVGYARRTVRVGRPELLGRRWFKVVLTLANPALGLLISLVPAFLYGNRLVERMFVGLCAGFLSHFVYSLVLKRLLHSSEGEDKSKPGGSPGEVEAPRLSPGPDE